MITQGAVAALPDAAAAAAAAAAGDVISSASVARVVAGILDGTHHL